MKRAPVRDIIWLFVATRLILVMVTYVGYILLTAPKYSSNPVDIVGILASWNHWDAANYVRIAQFGYQTPYDVAFFPLDRKSTRLNSSHSQISYAVFCLKKKNNQKTNPTRT